MADTDRPISGKAPDGFRVIILIGVLLLVICAALTALSRSFMFETAAAGRPVRLFIFLITIAFLLHLVALRAAIRLKTRSGVARWIILFGLAYRVILLPSDPIQEVDIYRYMWDGLVVSSGENPYVYSPRDVLEASNEALPDLLKLVELRASVPAVKTTLDRIHFAHLTTIYPPVSQFVFAAAAMVTPTDASIRARLVITKSAIVTFDVLTMMALLQLLKLFRKPEGWLICYAWSPLVLKEFANSGHLDAIAVGLAAWAVVWWLQSLSTGSAPRLLLAAAALGLGVGAKLYPVVLVPVIAVSVARRWNRKWFAISAAVLLFVSAVTLWPLFFSQPRSTGMNKISRGSKSDTPPLPDDFDKVVARSDAAVVMEPDGEQPTSAGLSAFMGSWKINDLPFMIIEENLIPQSRAWFSVVPDRLKTAITDQVQNWTGMSRHGAAFLITRIFVATIHILITCRLCVMAWNADLRQLPQLAFLSVAWFWLLLPTLNPWYWIWAMPLLPFVRLKGWLLMSGCVVLYYLRFWLQNDLGTQLVAGTGYRGAEFFNFVIVWVEFFPLLGLLLCEYFYRHKRRVDSAVR